MFYVIAMVTTKKISTEYTQRKMRRESKYVTTKKINKTQKETAREERGAKSYTTNRKQLTIWQ